MAASASPSSSSDASHSQFWNDFWNTLYQFSHPFSSTFFDSLLKGSSDESEQPQQEPPVVADTIPPTQDSKHFASRESFDKFWQKLQHGQYHHTSEPNTLTEHALAIWSDIKSASLDFFDSVDWEQTWIQMILSLHVLMFILIVLLRNRPNALAGMLFCTILLAALSEPLNGIGARHWQQFSNDNYFDSRGVFVSLVWATPLLGNAVLTV
ncbi:hypothetical protein BGZ94_001258, partial [Podila epigama]